MASIDPLVPPTTQHPIYANTTHRQRHRQCEKPFAYMRRTGAQCAVSFQVQDASVKVHKTLCVTPCNGKLKQIQVDPLQS